MKNKRNTKIVQKRSTLLQKLAYILRPFVIYMIVKTISMLTLAIFIPALPIQGIEVWIENNSYMMSSVVNAVSSIVAVCFLLDDFLKEAAITGEINIDSGIFGQLAGFCKNGLFRGKAASLILCTVFGAASALAINIGLGLLAVEENFGSEKYGTVEAIQYSVPPWLGIILYGVISPTVEEIVFRGVIFNRIKRFYPLEKAMIFSAFLFGAFHGNLPQFIYGTVMGVFMAFCYEWAGCFGAAVLFHMGANVSVFLTAYFLNGSDVLMTPFFCAVFMAISAVIIIGMKKTKKV